MKRHCNGKNEMCQNAYAIFILIFLYFFLKLANFLFSYNLHSKPEDVVVKDDKDLQMSSHGVKSLSTQEKNREQNRIR